MSPQKNPGKSVARSLTLALLLAPVLGPMSGPSPLAAQPGGHQHPTAPEAVPAAPETEPRRGLAIPDTPLVDQDGRPVRFYSDLVRGKVVAVNFIFTSCTTICPPMGASFARLRTLIGDRAGRDVHLISVSVDPARDTPARLKAWSERFGAGPGWTLVTGERSEVTGLLKALRVYTANVVDHSPLVLLGNDARGEWTRAYGLTAPARLAELIDKMAPGAGAAAGAEAGKGRKGAPTAAPTASPEGAQARHGRGGVIPAAYRAAPGGGSGRSASATSAAPATDPASPADPASADTPAHRYFGDIPLVDQDGRPRRLYSDLIAGKVVVIDFMFTSCSGACPRMSRTFERIQEALGERVGRDVHLLSISVDPQNDTPAKLKEYAARYHARPGWYFLTGAKADVEAALRKLGGYAAQPQDHQNLFILGNDATGLWKKAFGLADPAELLQVVASVADDRG